MAVIATTTLQPRQGTSYDEMTKELRRGLEIVRKHAGQNSTVHLLATMAGRRQNSSNINNSRGRTISLMVTCPDWQSYGRFQDALWKDSEAREIMQRPDGVFEDYETTIAVTFEEN